MTRIQRSAAVLAGVCWLSFAGRAHAQVKELAQALITSASAVEKALEAGADSNLGVLVKKPTVFSSIESIDRNLTQLMALPHVELKQHFTVTQMKQVWAALALTGITAQQLGKTDSVKKLQRFILDNYAADDRSTWVLEFEHSLFPRHAYERLVQEKRLLVFGSIPEMRQASYCPSCVSMGKTLIEGFEDSGPAHLYLEQKKVKVLPYVIKVDPSFKTKMLQVLGRLALTRTGGQLMSALYKASSITGKPVVIYGVQPCDSLPPDLMSLSKKMGLMENNLCSGLVATAETRSNAMASLIDKRPQQKTSRVFPGKGSASFIPVQMNYLNGQIPEMVFSKKDGGQLVPSTIQILLVHEMTHSLHQLAGLLTGVGGDFPDDVLISSAFGNLEEQRAIAGEPFYDSIRKLESALSLDGKLLCENRLRLELGGPERFGHFLAATDRDDPLLTLGRALELPLELLSDKPLKSQNDLRRWFGAVSKKARFKDLKVGDILVQRLYDDANEVQQSILAAQYFNCPTLGSRYATHVSIIDSIERNGPDVTIMMAEMGPLGLSRNPVYVMKGALEIVPFDSFDYVVYRPKDGGAASAAGHAIQAIASLGPLPYSFQHCMAGAFRGISFDSGAAKRGMVVSDFALHWRPASASGPQVDVKTLAKSTGFASLASEGMHCVELVVYAYQVGNKPYIKLDARSTPPAQLEHYLNTHSNKFEFVGVIPAKRASTAKPVELRKRSITCSTTQ